MNRIFCSRLFVIAISLVVSVMSSCSRTSDIPLADDGEEESNTEFALDAQYDRVRAGARLILAYDAQTNSFKGTVENMTNETLKQVRVEVHLSNGVELGPTPPGDLAPGEKRAIELVATGTNFDRWTAHPEVGGGGESSESGEHAQEGGNEHD